jgi:hypothetical protein
MPVLNAGSFLDRSVASILEQSYRDFEFVILDNGSRDGSVERLRAWAAADTRIRLVESGTPLGIAGSSNQVTELAAAPIVARMDQDDESLPRRLERELEVLTDHPAAALVGTLAEGIDERGRVVRPPDLARLLRRSIRPPFPHGSLMFRREEFRRAGGYSAEAGSWADLDLIQRMGDCGPMLVLTETLYRYRFTTVSTTGAAATDRLVAAEAAKRRTLAARKGSAPGSPEDAAAAALYEREAVRLWAGGCRPRLVGELVGCGLLSLRPTRLKLLAWGVLAWLSPGSMRTAVRTARRAANGWARQRLGDVRVLEWRFE